MVREREREREVEDTLIILSTSPLPFRVYSFPLPLVPSRRSFPIAISVCLSLPSQSVCVYLHRHANCVAGTLDGSQTTTTTTAINILFNVLAPTRTLPTGHRCHPPCCARVVSTFSSHIKILAHKDTHGVMQFDSGARQGERKGDCACVCVLRGNTHLKHVTLLLFTFYISF